MEMKPSKKDDKPWTKRELSLRPGPVQLALAVVERWELDGCPERDREAIAYWQGIINKFTK